MSDLKTIRELADQLELAHEHLVPYGNDKAKVRLEALESGRPPGKLILVSAITPTKAGEGKTTTSIGLGQGLGHVGHRACVALREPSFGPTLGMKGGATGGGRASLSPAIDINLHFTGDFHAISTAHNLLAAMLDNHLHHGNALGVDVRRPGWRRVLDVNDRALRNVVVGLGGVAGGIPRETGFDITAASEVMAVLCLAENEDDLRARLGRLIVGLNRAREPITAADLGAVGAMCAVLKDALMPNLVQTREGVPALVHGGPFANIAHGCNSVLATKMALAHADWVVTEAGFGMDLGGEKFFDVKCVSAGLTPAAVVLVATVRALKHHGGSGPDGYSVPDPAAVERGIPNLEKHVENVRAFGHEPVVALNKFATDSDDELDVVRRACERMGVDSALSDVHARGGAGGAELAEAVVARAETAGSVPLQPLYEWSAPFKAKMETIAKRIYGAGEVTYSVRAERDLRTIEHLGYSEVPLCVCKTPTSLSEDAGRYGRPEGFEIHVRNVLLSPGAGFVVPMLGDVVRMPGLPKVPQAEHMDVKDGRVVGIVGVDD